MKTKVKIKKMIYESKSGFRRDQSLGAFATWYVTLFKWNNLPIVTFNEK